MQHSINRTDTLRLFIHQLDLSGSDLQDSSSIGFLATEEHKRPKYPLSSPSDLDWVMKILKEDVRDNIDASKMDVILWIASRRSSFETMKKLLADLYSLCRNLERLTWTPLHYCVWFQDYTFASSLARQGVDLHSAALHDFWSKKKESPTSISLYSSTAFSAWRKVLEDENVPLEDFIMLELQHGCLKSEGWNKYSLLKVFALDFQPADYPEYGCEKYITPYREFSGNRLAANPTADHFWPSFGRVSQP